jgi:hypothetical protein
MKLSSCVLPVALALVTTLSVSRLTAQAPGQAPAQTYPDIHQFVSNLADEPATHTGLVFDRSMLQVARSLLQAGGMPPERASAALSSISFDNYRYAHPAAYAPDAMASLIGAYHSAGWKHLVNAHDPPPDSPDSVQHRGVATDLWLHFTGSDIDGVTVLARGSRNVNVIQVAGDLRPLDLIHLSGHFGIPKVDPNAVMVPAPDGH